MIAKCMQILVLLKSEEMCWRPLNDLNSRTYGTPTSQIRGSMKNGFLFLLSQKKGPTTVFSGNTHYTAMGLSLYVWYQLCCEHVIFVFNCRKFLYDII